MVCVDCGAHWYSAAAKSLIAQGATCDRCGGRLLLAADDEDTKPEENTNDE